MTANQTANGATQTMPNYVQIKIDNKLCYNN